MHLCNTMHRNSRATSSVVSAENSQKYSRGKLCLIAHNPYEIPTFGNKTFKTSFPSDALRFLEKLNKGHPRK